jgi:hypothetical protein
MRKELFTSFQYVIHTWSACKYLFIRWFHRVSTYSQPLIRYHIYVNRIRIKKAWQLPGRFPAVARLAEQLEVALARLPPVEGRPERDAFRVVPVAPRTYAVELRRFAASADVAAIS